MVGSKHDHTIENLIRESVAGSFDVDICSYSAC